MSYGDIGDLFYAFLCVIGQNPPCFFIGSFLNTNTILGLGLS